MPIVPRSWASCLLAVVLVGFGIAAGGCSSGLSGSSSAPSGEAPSFRDRMSAMFLGSPASGGDPAQASTPRDVDCPGVDIRSGAASYAVGERPGEASPTTLRYQAEIARSARECAVLGANMSIKVGIQGRVVLGPAGGPGQIEVPMRMAVVREGARPKTVWTKLYRIPVTVPPGQTSVPFMQIEENMTFPVPSPDDLAALVIYVGFDPGAGAPQQPERRRPHRKPGATG
jgi:hypothetical protein